ncbi:MAG: ATP-grasp domain-containing protein [Bacteroidales bacterium]|nr:ATP-grasp domain-containing protein [Bacteroidales bacterium]
MTSDKLITVLMLGGARRVSMAELLMQSGKQLGHHVRILSYELQPQVPIAAVADVIVGKKWSDADVVDDLVALAEREKVDIILPFVDGAIEIAARCAIRLPHVFVPVSPDDVAATMFDKIAAAKAFKDAEIPIPTTYSALTAEMPAIAKPRHGSASRGIKVFHNIEDLMHLEGISDYLVQEYIDQREEYTVDCYVTAGGDILCTVPRLREEVMGGEVTRTRTCKLPVVEEMSRKVLEAFELRGPVTLQFLHDTTRDRFLLMEVNPRLGGGVVCSIYAGAPIADYILKESMGQKLNRCDDWMPNTLMARYQKEVIFYDR